MKTALDFVETEFVNEEIGGMRIIQHFGNDSVKLVTSTTTGFTSVLINTTVVSTLLNVTPDQFNVLIERCFATWELMNGQYAHRLSRGTLMKIAAGKRLTKAEMAYEIGKVDPYNPAHLYRNYLSHGDILRQFNKVFNTQVSCAHKN